MGHIKLFEQFNSFGDEEDEWWKESESNKDLHIIQIKGMNIYYAAFVDTKNNCLFIFNDKMRDHNIEDYIIDPPIKEDIIIRIYDKNQEFGGRYFYGSLAQNWKEYLYRNLPKEIKDRLII